MPCIVRLLLFHANGACGCMILPILPVGEGQERQNHAGLGARARESDPVRFSAEILTGFMANRSIFVSVLALDVAFKILETRNRSSHPFIFTRANISQ